MNVSGIIYICFSNSVYDYFKYKYIIYITVRNYYPCRPDHVRLSVNMNVQIYATIITIDTTSRFKSRRICAIPPILVILIFLSISNVFESVSSCQPMLSYFDHQLLYLLPIAYLFLLRSGFRSIGVSVQLNDELVPHVCTWTPIQKCAVTYHQYI